MYTRWALEIVIEDRDLFVLLSFGAEVFDHLREGVVGGGDEFVDEFGVVGVAVGDEVEGVLGFEAVGHQVDLS